MFFLSDFELNCFLDCGKENIEFFSPLTLYLCCIYITYYTCLQCIVALAISRLISQIQKLLHVANI